MRHSCSKALANGEPQGYWSDPAKKSVEPAGGQFSRIAVGVTLAILLCFQTIARAAPFELSGVSLELGPWVTKAIFDMDGGERGARVAAIAQYRRDEDVVGDNLKVVIHIRDANQPNSWSSKTWTDQNGRNDAIKWAMDAWSIPMWQLDRWEVPVPSFDFTPPPQPVDFGSGVPVGDPFDGIKENLPNGDIILRWLEEAGYKAASLPKPGATVKLKQYLSILAASFEYGKQTGDDLNAAKMAVTNPPASPLPPLPGESFPWDWSDLFKYTYIGAAAVHYPGGQGCSPVYCDQTELATWVESGVTKKRWTRTRRPSGQSRSWGDSTSGSIVSHMSISVIVSCYSQSCNRIETRDVYVWPTGDFGRPPTIRKDFRLSTFLLQCCVENAPCMSPPPCILDPNGNPSAPPSSTPWGPTVPTIPKVIPIPDP